MNVVLILVLSQDPPTEPRRTAPTARRAPVSVSTETRRRVFGLFHERGKRLLTSSGVPKASLEGAWASERHELAERLSGGRTLSSRELTALELFQGIVEIEDALCERGALEPKDCVWPHLEEELGLTPGSADAYRMREAA